jgi:hypothetical protein
LFLTGLHDQQLVYAIKATIPLGQITFENVVDRYQRRCATGESPATLTLDEREDGKVVQSAEEEKHRELEKVYENEEMCERDVNGECEERSVYVVNCMSSMSGVCVLDRESGMWVVGGVSGLCSVGRARRRALPNVPSGNMGVRIHTLQVTLRFFFFQDCCMSRFGS